MHVLVIGATGEVGKEVIDALCKNSTVSRITALVRKEVEPRYSKLTYLEIDFDQLESLDLPQVSTACCCLGTTMKKAGSRKNFEKVDFEYVVSFAKLAKRLGATQFHVVSSLGASKSSFFFYDRVKGHMEEAIKAMSFISTYVYRPSMLDCDREEKRVFERIGILVFRALKPLMNGSFNHYAIIKTTKVAKGMVDRVNQGFAGYHIVPNELI